MMKYFLLYKPVLFLFCIENGILLLLILLLSFVIIIVIFVIIIGNGYILNLKYRQNRNYSNF